MVEARLLQWRGSLFLSGRGRPPPGSPPGLGPRTAGPMTPAGLSTIGPAPTGGARPGRWHFGAVADESAVTGPARHPAATCGSCVSRGRGRVWVRTHRHLLPWRTHVPARLRLPCRTPSRPGLALPPIPAAGGGGSRSAGRPRRGHRPRDGRVPTTPAGCAWSTTGCTTRSARSTSGSTPAGWSRPSIPPSASPCRRAMRRSRIRATRCWCSSTAAAASTRTGRIRATSSSRRRSTRSSSCPRMAGAGSFYSNANFPILGREAAWGVVHHGADAAVRPCELPHRSGADGDRRTVDGGWGALSLGQRYWGHFRSVSSYSGPADCNAALDWRAWCGPRSGSARSSTRTSTR